MNVTGLCIVHILKCYFRACVCVCKTEHLQLKSGRHIAPCSFLSLLPPTICIWYILNVAYCILCVMMYTLCYSETSVFTSTKGQVFIIW